MPINKSKPRVLLSAYQCVPRMEAVSQIGWQWYSRLAQQVPTTLVTHIRNRTDILKTGAPFADSEIIFIDTEWFAKPYYKTICKLFPYSEHARDLLFSPDFFLFDWLAIRQLKSRQKAGADWDIIHAVTPVSPMALTRLHTLKKPIILGPWNGGLKSPTTFPEIMREDSGWLYPIRSLGSLVNLISGTTKHATTILTATQATLNIVPKRHHSHCRYLIENGVDLNVFTPTPWPTPPSADQPLNILFVGRFQPFKGLPMLLEAIARLHTKQPIKLTVIGDGILREKWHDTAKELNINHLVKWMGPKPSVEIAKQLHIAHVLCLPSVRESGGAVLLEAMACARPVLTIKYGGPAEVVDDEVGYAIPPDGGTEQVINALVESLQDIAIHPEIWKKRGKNGSQKAIQLYGWDAKIRQALELYQEILDV
ncbi:glycosyltransferase family 4 protein [Candidatus Halobeggiatoa sp. HSG11]|nr:glycosyltransferase family 4 protein [Candidatus Halobeggiatoa sp. HSG11]